MKVINIFLAASALVFVADACGDECCTCLSYGGGAGCSDRCNSCSSDCQSCVQYGGGGGCVDDGRCSCGSSPTGSCQKDMDIMWSASKADSQGKRPDGRCYGHVSKYIDAHGYGGIAAGTFYSTIPSDYLPYAHDFADYMNKDGNAARLGLENIQSSLQNNPYNAPGGSIVVVRAGTPGTHHPTAGDIAISDGGSGYFWNGGAMGYGGSGNFPSSNNYVLGIYVPTRCANSLLTLNATSVLV